MTDRPARRPAALGALAGAVLLAGCAGTAPAATSSSGSPSGASSTAATAGGPASVPGQRIQVEVSGGQVTGDTGRVPVALGAPLTLVVTGDAADEVHVHGYDVEAELSPGQPAELSFDATISGVFEVELHEAGTLLLTLQVG